MPGFGCISTPVKDLIAWAFLKYLFPCWVFIFKSGISCCSISADQELLRGSDFIQLSLSPKNRSKKWDHFLCSVLSQTLFPWVKANFRGKKNIQKCKPQWPAFPRKTQIIGMIQLCCFIAFLTPAILCLPDANKILTRILGNTRDLQPLIT